MPVTWKETRLVPVIGTSHIVEGYENVCETCENWGDACESCNALVPITSEFETIEVEMGVFTICGIPVGDPYEIRRNDDEI